MGHKSFPIAEIAETDFMIHVPLTSDSLTGSYRWGV